MFEAIDSLGDWPREWEHGFIFLMNNDYHHVFIVIMQIFNANGLYWYHLDRPTGSASEGANHNQLVPTF